MLKTVKAKKKVNEAKKSGFLDFLVGNISSKKSKFRKNLS